LCCPVRRDPLNQQDASHHIGSVHGLVYPTTDGIPILLPDESERFRLARAGDPPRSGEPSPFSFYNHTCDHEHYCRDTLEGSRRDIERWLEWVRVSGPVLEIGSGKGALQGIGGDYVAVDYSLTALRRYIAPHHTRICATAERLPFPDDTFRFIFTVASLEHIPRADLAFDEIHRVLKPGGIAYLLPAWHCVQYQCEGIPVRPYRDLDLRQKLIKLSLPVRRNLLVKAATALPARLVRRFLWSRHGRPEPLRFERLYPDYERFWMSDSDAAARLDSHEACLYFHARGYRVLRPGESPLRQILARHEPVIVRKPD
jgi:SAM-dependent methyltransferase